MQSAQQFLDASDTGPTPLVGAILFAVAGGALIVCVATPGWWRPILRRALPTAVRPPSTRSTLIVLAAVAFLGFLAIVDYWPRGGIIANAMQRDMGFGGYLMPYRWLLAACVGLAAARLLVGDRRGE